MRFRMFRAWSHFCLEFTPLLPIGWLLEGSDVESFRQDRGERQGVGCQTHRDQALIIVATRQVRRWPLGLRLWPDERTMPQELRATEQLLEVRGPGQHLLGGRALVQHEVVAEVVVRTVRCADRHLMLAIAEAGIGRQL
ncbi:hypothetical protein BGI51_21675 [Pseudomonas oryzihabitans]|nr:hypothetical protein BGI51_21675 [Pseudomonas psychrotolerans]